MHKTWLIIKREYLTRVRKRSFVVVTLLVPLMILGFILLEAYVINGGNKQKQEIAVIDDSGYFINKLRDGNNIFFQYPANKNISTFEKTYSKSGYTGLLYIPKIDINHPEGFTYFGTGQLGINSHIYIENQLDDVIQDARMVQAGIDKSKLDAIKADVRLTEKTGEDQKTSSVIVATVVAFISGFLIYFIMLFFGMSVMRGVMEEKTNRIAEVVISSVRPFQLMLGKIVGIAGVGLTQFLIWLVLIIVIFTGLSSIAPDIAHHAQQMQQMQGGQTEAMIQLSQKLHLINNSNINFPLIIFCFFFYFLGGYLMYASLFAAVGSVVDQDAADAQSLTLPITLPIIISFFIMFNAVQQPNSALSVGASIFPLSSPLVMIARIPFGVPWWQIASSMVVLILTFMLTTWMAGKIYRTGILLYGKKVTLKEMGKWLFRKS
jgi:ABC-2 type transport system permease protein